MKQGNRKGCERWVFIFLLTVFSSIAAFSNPGQAFAAYSNGQAFIDWSKAEFSLSNRDAFMDWGQPASSQGSFSSATIGFNDPADIYNSVDFGDGFWSNTYAAVAFSSGGTTLAAGANTGNPPTLFNPFDPSMNFPANQIAASSFLNMTSGNTFGSIFSQAVISGQFTVSQDTQLCIKVPYFLSLNMDDNADAEYNFADVTAALVLSDFDTTDNTTGQSLILISDIQPLSNIGASRSGDLTFDFELLARHEEGDLAGMPFNYDLEVSATANASAAVRAASVPEPASFLLLASGFCGLIALRQRKSQT